MRGLAEGFPRLYSFIEDLRCVEEVSQLRIEDIVREFDGCRVSLRNDQIAIHAPAGPDPVVEARRVALKSETVALSPDILTETPDIVVKPRRSGTLRVLTNQEETDPRERPHAPSAYRIVRRGTVGRDGLSYTFEQDQVYDAPYSRFRFAWTEKPHPVVEVPVEQLRRQVSELLFQYLKQIRRARTRMVEFSIDIRGLVDFTPGFSGKTEDGFTDALAMRGIATNDFGIGGDPSVAMFVDGVWAGRTGGVITSFYDIERAEVVKGPQGTLFGRNSIAGAVSIITNKPSSEFEGSAELTLAEYEHLEGTATLNLPLNDQWALRGSFYALSNDGFLDNTEGGDELGFHDVRSGRLALRYAGGSVDAVLTAGYEDRDQVPSVYWVPASCISIFIHAKLSLG